MMIDKIQAFIDSRDPACDVCGASDFLMLGSTDSESLELSMRCIKHGRGLKRVISLGAAVPFDDAPEVVGRMVEAAAASKWSPPIDTTIALIDDVKWFAAHPGRTHRVRKSMAGDEYFELGAMTLVRKEKAGYSRIPLAEGIHLPDAEGLIAAVYEMSRKVIGQVAAERADGNLNMEVALARVKVLFCLAGAA